MTEITHELKKYFEDEQLAELISMRAAQISNERSERRFQGFVGILGLFITLILAAAGAGGVTLAQIYIENQVAEQVRDEVASLDREFAAELANIKLELQFFRLASRVRELEGGEDSIGSEVIRADTMNILRRIAEGEDASRDIRGRSDFADNLEQIIDALFISNYFEEIFELGALYEPEILSSSGILLTMINVYVRQTVGTRNPPQDWDDGVEERFARYGAALGRQNYPELELMALLYLDFMLNDEQPTDHGEELLREIAQLDTEDAAYLGRYLERYSSAANMVGDPQSAPPVVQRVVRRTNALLDAYPALRSLLDEDPI